MRMSTGPGQLAHFAPHYSPRSPMVTHGTECPPRTGTQRSGRPASCQRIPYVSMYWYLPLVEGIGLQGRVWAGVTGILFWIHEMRWSFSTLGHIFFYHFHWNYVTVISKSTCFPLTCVGIWNLLKIFAVEIGKLAFEMILRKDQPCIEIARSLWIWNRGWLEITRY